MAKVLVVEDDPEWQNLFEELVADAGYVAHVTRNYIDAVNALDHGEYVLLVVDISLSLPDHSNRGGVQVLRYNAARPTSLPAIVVTGHATVELAVETLAELNARYLFDKGAFHVKSLLSMCSFLQPAIPPRWA
jgi:DNA-binding NtrC family response regulator